jgi:NodT family efflux transporter outer membrane factor (OMF) lipoprotein
LRRRPRLPASTFNTPLTYKQAKGWVVAAPADALERGPWWTLFGDPELDALAARVEVSNQNVAAASAAYAQARALLAVQRAALFPLVSLGGGAGRSGSGTADSARNNFQASIGASWEPDVWGRLRSASDGAAASAQATAADLASARLSAQGELAVAYFGLRQTDAQRTLLAETLTGYQRSLQIAHNRYAAGIVARTDVLQAETQLANAQADALGLERSRSQYENAIAVLVGKTPADFRIAPRDDASAIGAQVPEVPTDLPSTLLQRRPDIAAAERRVAAANAQVGIARTAYYPSLGLNASLGVGATAAGALFNASSLLWSLGVSAAQTLFDAGATRERVNAASAANDQAVARYRQTVLVAFQDVENQLAATRVLAAQESLRRQAADAAAQVQAQVQRRYEAGQVSYSDVVAAQASALNARRALVQGVADRQTTAVALIQSLGGGWRAPG